MAAQRAFCLAGASLLGLRGLQRISPIIPKCVRKLTVPSRVLYSEAREVIETTEHDYIMNKTRRPMTRKRRPLIANNTQKSREKTVVSLAVAESFNLSALVNDPTFNGIFNVNFIDEDFEDVVYVIKKSEYMVNDELSDMFIFEDGVVVFWNVEANQRELILRDLQRFSDNPYDSRISLEELDRMPFSVLEGNSCIKSDRFLLDISKHNTDKTTSSSILERFAFSQGFAASAKIGVWESLLNEMSEPLSQTTKSLKLGKLPWDRKKALMTAGEFAALRHSINLDCNLLNRDFYWNREEIEKYYVMSARHFMLNRRLTALNSRLDYCEELVKMVDGMLALRHASRLEWAIIILIVIEVFFDFYHITEYAPAQKVVIVSKEQTEFI